MDIPFYETELLYRGVLPDDVFWKEDGTLSSAVFKTRQSNEGVSVDRQMDRSEEEALEFCKKHLHGTIVTVSVADVHECGAEVRADPIEDTNPFHALIVRTLDRFDLTRGQSKKLASAAKIVYREQE